MKNYTPEEKEALIGRLQQFYADHQRRPSHHEFPGTSTYERAFGSWNAALSAAGLTTRKMLGRVEVKCESCGQVFTKPISQITRYRNNFCTSACSARFHNKTQKHVQRSKAELYMEGLLRNLSNLQVEISVRDLLPSCLEIDIYLPEVNLAIELNGPLHYLPIYGFSRLELCQSKDACKRAEAEQMRIDLYVLDISDCKSWKATRQFLDEQFGQMSPLIQERLKASRC